MRRQTDGKMAGGSKEKKKKKKRRWKDKGRERREVKEINYEMERYV